MATDTKNPAGWENMKVRNEKRLRLKKVKRDLAKVEDRDITDTGLLDEILEAGLTKLEKRLGI